MIPTQAIERHVKQMISQINISDRLAEVYTMQPENTCPLIDKVLRLIGQIDTMLPYKNDHSLVGRLSEIKYELEEIRQANTDLRHWGHLLYTTALELDKENAKLIKKLQK
jgi:hypothetical protein